MGSRDYVKMYHDGSYHAAIEYLSAGGTTSPRDSKGKLMLRANPYSQYGSTYVGGSASGDLYLYPTADNAQAIEGRSWFGDAERIANAMAYGRLRGRLRKGGASLGVNFAQMKQSRAMIVARSNLLESSAKELSSLVSRKKFTKKLADNYLEYIFGWAPLVSDIFNSCNTVIQSADKYEYISSNGTSSVNDNQVSERLGWHREETRYGGTVNVRLATRVRIKNPNLWLAERAGLINPVAVAWDVVPFSFLINLVSNVGSLVNSISDFSGLEFSDATKTVSWKGSRYTSIKRTYPQVGTSSQMAQSHLVHRTLGVPSLPVKLEFRMPDVTWELAAMSAALAVQQAVPVLRLFKSVLNR